MKYTEEQKQKVRDIPIARMLNVQEGRNVSMRCPHPNHTDKTPSFLLRENNSFVCFGQCGAHGSGYIDFCMYLEFSFKEIMEEYAQD